MYSGLKHLDMMKGRPRFQQKTHSVPAGVSDPTRLRNTWCHRAEPTGGLITYSTAAAIRHWPLSATPRVVRWSTA
jgi:hypothetical protein